jgi:hypothetical protein
VELAAPTALLVPLAMLELLLPDTHFTRAIFRLLAALSGLLVAR